MPRADHRGVSPLHVELLDRLADDLGDAHLVAGLLDAYLRELPLRCAAIEVALAADPNELARAAHGLRSPSATLGVTAMAALCGDVEDLARAGDHGRARALAATVPDAAATVRDAIAAYIGVIVDTASRSTGPEDSV